MTPDLSYDWRPTDTRLSNPTNPTKQRHLPRQQWRRIAFLALYCYTSIDSTVYNQNLLFLNWASLTLGLLSSGFTYPMSVRLYKRSEGLVLMSSWPNGPVGVRLLTSPGVPMDLSLLSLCRDQLVARVTPPCFNSY